MGSYYMFIPGIDEKITCSTCGRMIPIPKVKESVVKCVGKKYWK